MKKLSLEEKDAVVKQYKSGKSVKDLSREFGFSSVSVYAWIKDFDRRETKRIMSSLNDKPIGDSIKVNGKKVPIPDWVKKTNRINSAGDFSKISDEESGYGVKPGIRIKSFDDTISTNSSLTGLNTRFWVICSNIIKKRKKYTKWEQRVINCVWG